MWEVVETNIDANFFFDEVPNTVEPEVLNSLSTKVSKDKFLWIACKSNKPPNKSSLESKVFLILYKFRFSRNFKQFVSKNHVVHDWKKNYKYFIGRVHCKVFVREEKETQFILLYILQRIFLLG